MLWIHVDRMNWKCQDYVPGYTLEVKQGKKKFAWSITDVDGKKIETGKQDNAMDAMNIAVAIVNKYKQNN